MQRAAAVQLNGQWAPAEADQRITLTFDQRWRRRMTLTTDDGLDVLLDLPQAHVLRAGDALVLDDGRLIAVQAANEELLEVRAGAHTSLARLTWHLGNRHTPTAIEPERILVRRDHVLADMLRQLGAEVRDVMAPFDPEGGAYATATGHAPRTHAHDQSAPHARGHGYHHHGDHDHER